MKPDIHPKYFEAVEIKCSCGNIIVAGSTRDKLKTELCSNCHPFFTGQQKLVDTAGRVDKFQAKRQKAGEMKAEAEAQSAASKKKKTAAYEEKVVPQEVLERAMAKEKSEAAQAGKWDAPLGDSPAQEIMKEEKKAAEVPMKKKAVAAKAARRVIEGEAAKAKKGAPAKVEKKTAVKKATAKKPAAKKVAAKKSSKK